MIRPQAMTGTTDKPSQLLRTNGNDTGSVCKPADFFNSLLVRCQASASLHRCRKITSRKLNNFSPEFAGLPSVELLSS
jgi:hypothetical protein